MAAQNIELPLVVLQSKEFFSLNARQKKNLSARIRYCIEIQEKAALLSESIASDFLEQLTNIELDVSVILGHSGEPEESLSAYRIRSSWAIGCSKDEISNFIDADALEVLQQTTISFSCAIKEMRAWVIKWSQTLDSTLKKFSAAESYTKAFAALVLIDALLASYLTFCTLARLNIEVIEFL